jgi:citronellol/citronellal dehydrogenase
VADAAVAIVKRPSRECTGNFFIDEQVLLSEGVEDLTRYAVDPSQEPLPDFFL